MPDSFKPVQPRFQQALPTSQSAKGKVVLVGAGPGDPGLLTLRGAACLKAADKVLYDGLANPQLLGLAPNADKICVGKHGKQPIWSQAEINQYLVELARQGHYVVRLKGGDPAVFARTAEELEVLVREHIAFEVVPGITAALAAASYVGIPITHRDHASAVAFITGQQRSAGQQQNLDWEAFARFPGTLVFYMGVTTVHDWTAALLAAGKDPATPAAIVRRCSWSDQLVVRCTLGSIVEQLQLGKPMRPPVIVIVGDVAALGSDFDWFSRLELKGAGVLVTRPEPVDETFVQQLQAMGATAFIQPMIELTPPQDRSALENSFELIRNQQVDGITFSSANGVHCFFEALHAAQLDSRALFGIRLAAVGPATGKALRRYGLTADVMPTQNYSADGLLLALGESVRDQTWIVTKTNASSGALEGGLRQASARVEPVTAYMTKPTGSLSADTVSALEDDKISYVTLTSRTIACTANELLAPYRERLTAVCLSRAIFDGLDPKPWAKVLCCEDHSSAAILACLQDDWAQR